MVDDPEEIPRPSEEVVSAFLERFRVGLRLMYRGQEMQRQGAELSARGEKLVKDVSAGASAFGIDLIEEMKARSSEQLGPPEKGADLLEGRPSVKDFILSEAEEAFPQPVRAASLRAAYAQRYGLEVHEKTFGMTLYRTSQRSGAVKRVGKADWFFVPEGQRVPQEGQEQSDVRDLF